MLHSAIVCTTIFDLNFLPALASNLQRYGHRADTKIIVIPDRKSPPSTFEYAQEWRKKGLDITYPTIDEQEVYLSRFPKLRALIPYDSDNRRNVGFLMALEAGAELVISIDDDNYPLTEHDFVGSHAVCGKTVRGEHVHSPNGWYN